MAAGEEHSEEQNEKQNGSVGHASGVAPGVLLVLEGLDNIAHVLVAIFFILLSASVLVYSGLMLVRDLPLLAQRPDAGGTHVVSDAARGPSLFLHSSLELLSSLLFAVIVLELLKTIITYLKTHNIQAIMKEFLVVGIISSIRKILLIGAESSLGTADPTAAYVKEATGTVITIAGILLLIVGLILLQRSEHGNSRAKG